MKTKTTRLVDPVGRISIPGYLRELTGIRPGDTVAVEVNKDNSIRIYATGDCCCICEKPVKDAKITVSKDHHICIGCARAIAYTLDNKEE